MITYTGPVATVTTTGNIDDLDFSNASLIRMNNASDATIRGLKAGVGGQRVTIVSIGAGNVYSAHQDTNSAAANRQINCVTSAAMPLAAGSGAMVYQYDATTARWRMIAHEQGAWIVVPYVAGDFTGSGTLVWTVDSGDVLTWAYLLKGTTLLVDWSLTTTSVSGTGTELRIKIPGGFTVTRRMDFPTGLALDNGVNNPGFVFVTAGAAGNLRIKRIDFANWAASTNNTDSSGQIGFQVT